MTMQFPTRKRIALIAHDARKQDMIEWAKFNKGSLAKHDLYATGTTGTLVSRDVGLDITLLKSGPLGGDQQVGAMVAEHAIDIVIFLWDPMRSHPHEPDIHALQRIATVYNIVLACDRSTADFVISSPMMKTTYTSTIIDYEGLRKQEISSLVK